MNAMPPTPAFLLFAAMMAFGAFVSIRYPTVAHKLNPVYSAEEHKSFGRLYVYGSIAMLVAGAVVAVIRNMG